jgi:hypothetical protein
VQLHIGESRDSGFDAEPVIGPRFARTGWHRPGMTESIEIVITGLDPVIHLLRKNFLRRLMDARIKSGHDGCVLWSTPFSETVIASQRVARMECHLSPCGRGRIASTDAIRVRGYGPSIGRAPSPIEVGYIRLRQFDMPNSGKPELGGRGSAPPPVQVLDSNSQRQFICRTVIASEAKQSTKQQKERWIASLRSQ